MQPSGIPIEIPQSKSASSSMDALLQESTPLTPSSKLIIQISKEVLAKAPMGQTLLLTVPLRDLVSNIITGSINSLHIFTRHIEDHTL